jgi:glutamine amidotransferase
MLTVIIDYGMGNLGSARRAFEECGSNVLVSDKPEDIFRADKILLPGVGSYRDGMKLLKERGFYDAIHKAVEKEIPLLGICLGMQLLADKGYEGGETDGLGLIHGEVDKFQPQSGERIPHIGWNEIYFKKESYIFQNVLDATDFYFVHSYHFAPTSDEDVIGKTPYCGGFVSAVGRGHVFGTQFHPEKSQKPGFALIKSFLEY